MMEGRQAQCVLDVRGEEIMEREQGCLVGDLIADVVEGLKNGGYGRLNCRSRLGESPVTGEIDRILCFGSASSEAALNGSEA